MTAKYHVTMKDAPPRHVPIAKLSAMEIEGCLGCRKCVKRESCVYDVYGKRKFNAQQMIDSGDSMCISCMRCVQECKKNILSRTFNPQFAEMGDDHWKPELIASIWKQSENGKIPVSGAGYRGPFAGPGFDQMWTDMSEIVRPTRDGIHGREYISTVIELGRRPGRLAFDESGQLLTEMPYYTEIPIPMLLEVPDGAFISRAVEQSVVQGAVNTGTLAIVSHQTACHAPENHKGSLMVKFDPERDDAKQLEGIPMVELEDCRDVREQMANLKVMNPKLVTSIMIPCDDGYVKRAGELAEDGAEVLRFRVNRQGYGFGSHADTFMTELIKEVHFELINRSVRDRVTVIFSGGIAMAEHVAKSIACGTDGVGIDFALLAAMECRLCVDCGQRENCPVGLDKVPIGWGGQRVANLIGAWHSQLIEVMGAMGLREVRRLRGELGRVMFFDGMEKDNLAPVFGDRIRPLLASLEAVPARSPGAKNERPAKEAVFPLLKGKVSECASRFRNALGRYKVSRSSRCVACGKCAEVCDYQVHKRAGRRLLAPKSHFCIGTSQCRSLGICCVDVCPESALRVGPDPMWAAFGDPRWPAEMLASTWYQAETGRPPREEMDYKTGNSGGGFDRINIVFPSSSGPRTYSPRDVDLSIPLNRRTDDGRPGVTIGVPFYGGGMSYGSISLPTMLARARAYKAVNSFTNTGEGGYPEELQAYDEHVITQVATGLFGVSEDSINRVRMVEFKYAQGAKPGLGGHLLGDKNTPAVSKMRETVPGYPLFSPFPFHSVYSVEDHKKHVDWVKQMNTRALVAVKVAGACDVDMVAVGSYYAGAHVVHLDGSYGGTGASPDIAKKNIAMPIEYAIPKVHQFLMDEGVRDEITLIGSGGIRSAWDVAKLIAMGANGVVIGTPEVVALECIRCGVCESGRGCPRSIATTDPELSQELDGDWAAQRLTNFFHSWAIQLQDICWRLGLRSIRQLVGRSDLLAHLDYDNRHRKENVNEYEGVITHT
ncbi:glutamate synthase-related protein [Fibrobacterota bacterium]